MQTAKDGDRIVEEARKWIGTPYIKLQRAFQMGVDCAGLVYMVGHACGADIIDMPHYSGEPSPGQLTKAMKERLDRVSDIEVGCIIQMRIHQHPQHLGIATADGTFIHASMSPNAELNKVIETRITESFKKNNVTGYWTYRWQS